MIGARLRPSVARAACPFVVAAALCSSAAAGRAEPPPYPASVTPLSFSLPRSVAARAVSASPDPALAATPASRRVLARVLRVLSTQRVRRYEHRTVIRERDGVYLWDCSAMVAWMLRNESPRALGELGARRPVARDIAAVIARSRASSRRALTRVLSISDVAPGDLFAWRRPADWGPGVTGHSGFVIAAPERIPGTPNAWLLRIADATSLPHGEDSREENDGGGLGTGTLLLLADDAGHVTHYGWFGLDTRFVVRTDVFFARLWS